MSEELKKKITDFLTEWSSCDNRCTAWPYFWTIADERVKYEPNDWGDWVWDDNNYEMREIKSIVEELNEQGAEISQFPDTTIQEVLDDWGNCFYDDFVDACLDTYFEGKTYKRFEPVEETYYEGCFLTQADAEEYLESASNHHFGPNPRTYLTTFNKWSRHSRTEDFLNNLFEYFDVPVPPKLYKEDK